MDENKIDFVRQGFLSLLKTIDKDTKPAWGLMNVQQMIEHMSDSFRVANGKVPQKIITPLENIPKMKAFIMSDIPFKENTKNRTLPEAPAPLKNTTVQKAVEELQKEIEDFFTVFKNAPDKIIDNSIFGDLNFNEWIHLLNKHCIHHLKQFHK
jgi:hypothetical protein